MSYLADTNIVVRWTQTEEPQHELAVSAIEALLLAGETIYITPQVLTEFWALATRPPAANGLGMTLPEVIVEIQGIENFFPLLPEIPEIFPHWRTLVETHGIMGRQVYDARLVAVMQAHGVTHLLTFNVNHFQHFPGITVVDPATV